jgi:hypothetical protein
VLRKRLDVPIEPPSENPILPTQRTVAAVYDRRRIPRFLPAVADRPLQCRKVRLFELNQQDFFLPERVNPRLIRP